MKLGAVASLPTISESRTWYRVVPPSYWRHVLSATHTLPTVSRFKAKSDPFQILYLAQDSIVAQFEARALLGSISVPIAAPGSFAVMSVHVKLSAVIDLSDVPNQVSLDTTAQELTGDWSGYHLRGSATRVRSPVGKAPTQDLGLALFNKPKLAGFLSVSAQIPTRQTLMVFPTKLGPGDYIELEDPSSGTKVRVPAGP